MAEKEKKPKLSEKEENKKIVEKCKEYWDTCKTYYHRDLKRMFLLDAMDNGDIWKALRAKFPSYQILPDTNYVSYVKENMLASLYTTTKSAEVVPTSADDAEICMNLNIALENEWDVEGVGFKQFEAGERAALLNIGITQVGWNESFHEGTKNNFKKGTIALKNVDPMKFRRDPFADSLKEAHWCMTFEEYHKSVFKRDKRYKDTFEEYCKHAGGTGESVPKYLGGTDKSAAKDYYTLYIYWVKKDGKINEYHIINNEELLYKKEGIRPNIFPFAILYCNPPSKSLIGVSNPAKIMANNVAYNMMQSVALTAEYKNQRPPKFVSASSGLNIQSFSKHGDEADRTFIVNGDASQAVHYHQFPPVSPTLPNQMMTLSQNIQDVSGVDGRYTGRDTGSIITTGGTEEMLNRVTLVDTPKITLYEEYAKDLTKLVLLNLIEYAPKRKYFVPDKQEPNTWKSVEIDFPNIDKDTVFHYAIQISSELPKNKQRVMAFANTMMEKQMQYREAGDTVELITPEEWLRMQDIPYKEQMLERMGMQKRTNILEQTAQSIYEYGQMVDAGMTPEDALVNAAQGVMNRQQGQPTPLEQNMMETPQESLAPDNLLGGIV